MPSSSWASQPQLVADLRGGLRRPAAPPSAPAVPAGCVELARERRAPARGPRSVSARPAGGCRAGASTLPCDWPWRTSTSRPLIGPPLSQSGQPAVASSRCRWYRTAAEPVGHEPRYRTSAQRRCSALSASATAIVVDVADAVQEEDVGAQFVRVGRDSIRVRSMSRIAEFGQRRRPARLARCRAAAPPTCGRRRCARGGGPGGPTSTKRVRALGSSTTPSASVGQTVALRRPARCSPRRRHGRRRRRAPPRRSNWPGRQSAAGRCSASQRRTCAAATGKAATVRDIGGRCARPHDDAERDVERQLGEDLQRRARWRGCPGWAAPSPRSSSRSARRRSRRRRRGRLPARPGCCRSATGRRSASRRGPSRRPNILHQCRLGEGPSRTEIGDAGHGPTLSGRPRTRSLHVSLARTARA